MKKSEEKQKLAEELAGLSESLDINRLYAFPNQNDTQKWIADVRSVLKNLDESDYQEFVRLSKTVGLSEHREERKKAAKEINQFLKGKVVEWQRYDFSDLNKKKDIPKMLFGQAGRLGQSGSGGSIFIQAENLNVGGGGRISADGGDVIQSREIINFGSLNQQTAGTVNNISELTQVVSDSNLEESEKRQLIGDVETIKAQIVKPKPDKKILQIAWGAAKSAATIGGAVQLVKMIGEEISPFLR